MSDDEVNKRLAQIHREVFSLRQRGDLIKARHIKGVWSDTSLDVEEYNKRPKLREAELILRLANDKEYQEVLKRLNELEAEQIELGDEMFGGS